MDLVQLEDPFPHNPGAKTGALVEAKVGKGRWIYLGLGLWRQLPAGTDGAYALLANLAQRRQVVEMVAALRAVRGHGSGLTVRSRVTQGPDLELSTVNR